MFSFLVGLIVGLFVAWFMWPAPTWAVQVRDWVFSKLPFLKRD